MIARNDSTQAGQYASGVSPANVAGVVCPACGESMLCAFTLPSRFGRYGRVTRRSVGWCNSCDNDLELLQFMQNDVTILQCESGGEWVTYQWRTACSSDDQGCRAWQVVCDLPETAPVVVGPGGGFDQAVNLEAGDGVRVCDKVVAIMKRLFGRSIVSRGHVRGL